MFFYTFMPKLFNMSLTAGVAICVVILLRLLLKKAPKVISYAMWAVVLFRLLCPVSFEAEVSLFNIFDAPIKDSGTLTSVIEYVPENIVHTEHPSVSLPVPGLSEMINEALPQGQEQLTADPLEAPMSFITYLWMIGIIVMVTYSIISYAKLRSKLLASTKLRDSIYIADDITSPFVMGLIRPKIYLPSSLPETERDYIILHEQHHIKRCDHIVKLLSFAALCLHWFNPLVWAAFILSGKDMEMSCDEAVLKKMGEDIRADYSASLISLATGRRIISGTPLAFGEGDTEGRVKNIAKWKKPAVWVIVIAVIVCAVLAVCLITNPMNRDTQLWGAEYRIEEILYRTSEEYDHTDDDAPSVCITADYGFWVRDDEAKWQYIGQMEPYTLTDDELRDYTAWDDGWQRRYRTGEITDSYILRMNETEYEAQMFLAFRTKRGDTLLGVGVEDISERWQGASDDTSLHCLMRIESTFGGTHLSGAFHERSLTHIVGGDVDSFHTWTNAKIPGFVVIGFYPDDAPYTEGTHVPAPQINDMGFAVFAHNKDESGYKLIQYHVYEDAALAKNGVFTCPHPAILDRNGEPNPETTYDIVFVNNEAVERVTREYLYTDGTSETISETHIGRLYMAMFPQKYYKDGCTVRQTVYDEDGEVIGTPVEITPPSFAKTALVLADFDLTNVNAIEINSAYTGKKAVITDPGTISALTKAVQPITGSEPISARGYYGGSYSLAFYEEAYPDSESIPILRFGMFDDKAYGEITSYLLYGFYEEVNGHSYPGMYPADPALVDAVEWLCAKSLGEE